MVSVLSVSDPVPAVGSSDNAEGKSTAEVEVPELRQRNGAPRPRSARAPADRAEAAARRAEVAADKARAENAALAAALEEAKAELARLASAHRDLVAIVEASALTSDEDECSEENSEAADDNEGTSDDEEERSEVDCEEGIKLMEELAAKHSLTLRQEARLSELVAGARKACKDLNADFDSEYTRLGKLLSGGSLRDRDWLSLVFVGAGGDQLSRGLGLRFLLEAPAGWLRAAHVLAEYFEDHDADEDMVFSECDRVLFKRFRDFWHGLLCHFFPVFREGKNYLDETLPGSLRCVERLVRSFPDYLGRREDEGSGN